MCTLLVKGKNELKFSLKLIEFFLNRNSTNK